MRLSAIIELGNYLRKHNDSILTGLAKTAHLYNPWFTEENVLFSIRAISNCLDEKKVLRWFEAWKMLVKVNNKTNFPKKIGIVMAGNIPMVGIHDMLCVLAAGDICMIKTSSKDHHLIPYITKKLCEIAPEFKEYIFFVETLKDIDAVIATGSNNTSRYFEYYFGKYPNIIRKNRSSAAVLDGKETKTELELLCCDIFQYFGLGCRNISKLYVPKNYDFDLLIESMSAYRNLINHNKYMNNYDYNKTIFLMNKIAHIDCGFIILKEDKNLHSPIAALHYEYYSNINNFFSDLEKLKNEIQCIVSHFDENNNNVNFGKTQFPELWDYADNVDTMRFLLKLN